MERLFAGVASFVIMKIGVATIVPNMMISDNGSARAIRSARIGLASSKMFIATGVLGIVTSAFVPKYIKYIPIGVVLSVAVQILAFFSAGYIKF